MSVMTLLNSVTMESSSASSSASIVRGTSLPPIVAWRHSSSNDHPGSQGRT